MRQRLRNTLVPQEVPQHRSHDTRLKRHACVSKGEFLSSEVWESKWAPASLRTTQTTDTCARPSTCPGGRDSDRPADQGIERDRKWALPGDPRDPPARACIPSARVTTTRGPPQMLATAMLSHATTELATLSIAQLPPVRYDFRNTCCRRRSLRTTTATPARTECDFSAC